MNEQELRAIVRDAIARHAGAERCPRAAESAAAACRSRWHVSTRAMRSSRCPPGRTQVAPCVIEPAVACNHCGYCKSYGH